MRRRADGSGGDGSGVGGGVWFGSVGDEVGFGSSLLDLDVHVNSRTWSLDRSRSLAAAERGLADVR